MKTKLLLLCAAGLLVALTRAQAATLYVDAASTNAVPPFANWTTAAANIQDAVDAADTGDEIMVTNGVYQTGAREVYGMSNRVAVTKAVTVRSVNGPAYTSIVGHGPIDANAIRCVYLTNGAVLAGFTLTNGASGSGGGVLSDGPNATVSNCVLKGNSSGTGGGVYGGTLNNCMLTGNSAILGGGAADATLYNCTLIGNRGNFAGGGASGGTLNSCTLIGNWGDSGGGATEATLNNCTLTGNSAYYGGGASGCSLNHCTLTDNSAHEGGGVMYGSADNCTITGNSAAAFEGAGGGAASATLNNCIIYHNSADDFENYSGCTLNYSCTTPHPGNGVGNITNAPLFVDTNGWSNLRLQSNSPCINAGHNASVASSTDLDDRPRIVGGVVDMGAYEYQGPGTGEFIGWLQQSGLPTDGSADDVDTDHDDHNNWQEWMAGTDPTNALSVLRLLRPAHAGADVTLTWLSVTNRTYVLECSTNLVATPPFTTLATNLPGQPGTTSWTDINATVSSPRFYQLRVSP